MKIRAELRIYEIFINNLKKSVTTTIQYYIYFLSSCSLYFGYYKD